ncbi:hypothetical protein HanPSC8_Chr00c215g0806331 [Helianthus annuus]|nr:hypothetical protein HanPSC8_Chr00c215g0806331 [Helianthus annuus]
MFHWIKSRKLLLKWLGCLYMRSKFSYLLTGFAHWELTLIIRLIHISIYQIVSYFHISFVFFL